MAAAESPPPLTMRKLLRLYLPLAFTFLLMSGSSPIINKGIGALPGGEEIETIGLGAFANAFAICLFLYSPVFLVRDAAQKFVRGATSYRRVVLFHLGVSTVCTGFLLVVALTPIADELLLRMLLNLPDDLVGPVKRAVIAFLPIPTFIIFRGVHQAVHITNDTPGWIGVGTILRFVVIIAFVFLIAVPRELEGGMLGGLAFTIGIGTEMVVMVVTARKHAKFLRSDPPGVPPPTYGDLWAFCFPMFLANIMGVCMQPVTSAIVNGAVDGKTSAAAFGVLRSFVWFFSSTLFAMQAMALAKADSVRNLVRLLFFELIPVGAFTALIFVTAFVEPVREAVLVDFFEIDNEVTLEFVRETLPIALVLPLLMAMRSTVRGLILRSGKTRWVTFSNLVALLALFGVSWVGPSASAANGAAVGYVCWLGALGVELAISLYGLRAIGIRACVTEGGRQEYREYRDGINSSGPRKP